MPDYGSAVADSAPVPDVCLSTLSLDFNGGVGPSRASGTGISSAVLVANQAILMPFVLNRQMTAYKLGISNGTAVAGNVDIGIYNSAFARQVSIGSTAAAGTNVVQEFNIADTLLAPGLYYLAVAANTGAGMNFNTYGIAGPASTNVAKGLGIVQMAAAFPLPATITPAIPTYNVFPLAYIYFRASP